MTDRIDTAAKRAWLETVTFTDEAGLADMKHFTCRLLDALDTKDAEIERLRDKLCIAMDACRIIDEVALEGHDDLGRMVAHFCAAIEPARAALNGEGER